MLAEQDKLDILLVEDNPADVELFGRFMSGPYRLTVAETGVEAVDRLLQRGRFQSIPRPDVVVLDLNVPILNGHQILNVMRVNPSLRSIPVVVFSISDRPDDVRKTYDLGACAYLVKRSSLAETEKTLSAFADFWIRQVVFPGLMRVPGRASEGASSPP
jgi:chemotaxis family two-component system response regulator Rcp1